MFAVWWWHQQAQRLITHTTAGLCVCAALLISWPYTAAMSAGVAEFLLEARCWPQLKQHHNTVSCIGLALVIVGEAIRKLAMVCVYMFMQ